MVKTYRINYPKLEVVESINNGNSWKKSYAKFPEAIKAVKLFKVCKNINLLIDSKNPKFLKGQIINGKIFGARINILPTGQKLDKSYSLFSPKLIIHDEKSHSHWDVMFQNPNGKFAYLYTLEKKKLSKNAKYKEVEEFEKKINLLEKNLNKHLGKDPISLAMLVLLKTKMRIGNEAYYLKNEHKGLTTLKKEDIKINGKLVIFDYIAKDGVPQRLIEKFPINVINELKNTLKKRRSNDFVFINNKGHPFKDTEFEKAFEKYCGEKFYPHIVRSCYATQQVKDFLKTHKSATKKEQHELYTKIAEELGHKSFSKKKNEWVDSYKVTINYYIQPELVEKIDKIVCNTKK